VLHYFSLFGTSSSHINFIFVSQNRAGLFFTEPKLDARENEDEPTSEKRRLKAALKALKMNPMMKMND
jgi:hypothetical protein